jgi:hypothetical protein
LFQANARGLLIAALFTTATESAVAADGTAVAAGIAVLGTVVGISDGTVVGIAVAFTTVGAAAMDVFAVAAAVAVLLLAAVAGTVGSAVADWPPKEQALKHKLPNSDSVTIVARENRLVNRFVMGHLLFC